MSLDPSPVQLRSARRNERGEHKALHHDPRFPKPQITRPRNFGGLGQADYSNTVLYGDFGSKWL